MRETRLSGLEGGVASNAIPTPILNSYQNCIEVLDAPWYRRAQYLHDAPIRTLRRDW